MSNLKDGYSMRDKELSMRKSQNNTYSQEIAKLDHIEEVIEGDVKKVKAAQGRPFELKKERYYLHFWEFGRRKELDREIEQSEADAKNAQDYFRGKYHITPDDVPAEIKRIQKKRNIRLLAKLK